MSAGLQTQYADVSPALDLSLAALTSGTFSEAAAVIVAVTVAPAVQAAVAATAVAVVFFADAFASSQAFVVVVSLALQL